MKKTYRNRLQKGMEVENTNIRVENGEVLVEVEFKDKFEPKDGDFLHDKYYDITVIYKETSKTGIGFGMTKDFRYATPEEKSAFLKRLESEAHLRWNAETKKLEPIRWRAAVFEEFCYVDSHGDVCYRTDDLDDCSNNFYDIGNYFRTEEAAQKVADQIKEIFKNSKAE